MFPIVGALAASVSPEIIAGAGIAAMGAFMLFSNLFKPVEPQLPTIDPSLKGFVPSTMEAGLIARLPGDFSPKDAVNYGVMAATFVAFMEFILEEAIQAVGMGVWQAVSNDLKDKAKELIAVGRDLVSKLKTWCEMTKLINPFSYEAFISYAEAADKQLDVFETIIKKGKKPYYAKTSGGVFDMR